MIAARHIAALFCFIVASMAAMMGSALANCDANERVITIATSSDATRPAHQRAVAQLKSLVDQDLQGRACLQLVSDTGQFKDELIADAVRKGTVHLAFAETKTLSTEAPALGILSQPFAFRDFQAVTKFSERETLTPVYDTLASKGLQAFGLAHEGFDQLVASRLVVNPDDMLGLRIAVSLQNTLRWFLPTKAIPKEFAEDEKLKAFVRKDAEGAFARWNEIVSAELAKNAKVVLTTNHRYHGYALIGRKEWWDGLEPPLARGLEQSFTRALQQANFETVRRNRLLRDVVIRADVPVYTLTQTQWNRWRAAVQPTWDEMVATPARALLPALEAANALP
ncbi:MAG: TRAP transporter substrate-binding protein DctP [Pseudomonadota bacterium]